MSPASKLPHTVSVQNVYVCCFLSPWDEVSVTHRPWGAGDVVSAPGLLVVTDSTPGACKVSSDPCVAQGWWERLGAERQGPQLSSSRSVPSVGGRTAGDRWLMGCVGTATLIMRVPAQIRVGESRDGPARVTPT